MRLTGKHETAAIGDFTYGIATAALRSAFRTPSPTMATRAIWKIAARTRKATPTRSLRQILKTIAQVPTGAKAAAPNSQTSRPGAGAFGPPT